MDKFWYLENINMFKILCPHKYKAYKDCHNYDYYQKNDYIYFEEDAASKVYLIEKGKVKLGYYNEDGTEVVKSILGRGELFGENAILGEDMRNEFAKSLSNTTSICPIGVETLHDLMRDNQTFTLKIYKFINFRIRKLERRLKLLLFKDAKTRVTEFLEELCEDYGFCCEETGGTKVKHSYTQKDIASLIGTSRPTLNIVLNELQEEGVIQFGRNEFILLEKSA